MRGKGRRVLIFCFLSLFLLSFEGSNPSPRYFEISKSLDVFGTLFKELNIHYVEEIDPTEVIKSGIDAMLGTLDPYTIYIPEEEVEKYRIMTTGEYGGIGVLVEKMKEGVFFRKLYEDSPAHAAGLRVGDEVLQVNGISVEGKQMDDISHLLRGEVGTKVGLTVARYGIQEPFETQLVRQHIKIRSVPHYDLLDGDMGYIQLAEFHQHAGDSLRSAFVHLEEQGMKRLILDLRDNPGGFLHEAVSVSELFVPRGSLVVRAHGRVTRWNKSYQTQREPVHTDLPLVVLVNEHTASAAEIVSGVLQDYDRGIVMGRSTLGKGLVQASLPLSYNAQLKVTTARYYLPSGRCVQKVNYAKPKESEAAVGAPFKTKGGRVMQERRGIAPDILTADEPHSRLVEQLLTRRCFFHYANKYYYENRDEKPDLDDFPTAVASVYDDFVAWVADRGYRYHDELSLQLNRTEQLLQREGLLEKGRQPWEEVRDLVHLERENPWLVNKKAIQHRLSFEILSRYYTYSEVASYTLLEDPSLIEARKLLEDEEAYARVLAPDE